MSTPAILANDFQRQWSEIGADVVAAVERVGRSGWYVLGEEVRLFERELADYWGLGHAVGVASGLDAIEIGLRILGCGPGDRVLTTPLSAFATTLAIVKLGAVPVFVDTDARGLIDLGRCGDVFRRWSVRYFVPVHLYGHTLDLDILQSLRDEYDLRIVEDCAQSVGARFRGRAAGTVGQIAATSFYPTKNLGGMGDGGAILTSDASFDAQARVLRFYGETARYSHQQVGYNSRLDEIQAALLRQACLPRLDQWLRRRRAIAASYQAGIRHPYVTLPEPLEGSASSWHLFPVQVAPPQRSSLLDHLKAAGIGAGIHYPAAIPDQPVMAGVACDQADDCATARRIAASEVSLPIHPYLSGDEVQQVIAAVTAWRPAGLARGAVQTGTTA